MPMFTGVLSLISTFWMVIYLYGLFADQSVKYNHAFWIFPVITFLISALCLFMETKRIGKSREAEF